MGVKHVDIIKQEFKKLLSNKEFITKFKNINEDNPYLQAKKQEQLCIEYIPHLNRLNNDYNDYKNFDSELDLKFGDFKDIYGNYWDLKVGDKSNDFCGSITKRSLKNFGDTKTDRHFYLCVNSDFNKFYIINARQLKFETFKLKKFKTNKEYLGELDYIKSKYAIISFSQI